MKQKTIHKDQITSLKRIEGQIRGIQKMIEEERYCVDILTQLHSIIGALRKVSDNIFHKHLKGCVAQALKGKSDIEKEEKIQEIINLISKFRR